MYIHIGFVLRLDDYVNASIYHGSLACFFNYTRTSGRFRDLGHILHIRASGSVFPCVLISMPGCHDFYVAPYIRDPDFKTLRWSEMR